MKSAKKIAAGFLVDPEPDQLEALTLDIQTIQRHALLHAAKVCRDLIQQQKPFHNDALVRSGNLAIVTASQAIEAEAHKLKP